MDEQNNVSMGQVSPNSVGSTGVVIGAIVILLVLVLGIFYFWKQDSYKMPTSDNIQSVESQSQSDETDSIEADLNSTNVDNLDAELNAS